MEVELREITSETVRPICELEVAVNQRSFVAPNAVSIAEAHFTPGHWMRAIYADGQPVGFVLTLDEPSEGYFLWRFMIAEGHQRRGVGRRALQQALALARARSHGGADQRGAVEHRRDSSLRVARLPAHRRRGARRTRDGSGDVISRRRPSPRPSDSCESPSARTLAVDER